MRQIALTLVALLTCASLSLSLALAQAPPAPTAGKTPTGPVFDRARFYPPAGHESAMVGGRFAGSNVSATAGFETLAEIKDAPPPGQWTELTFKNTRPYRWIRYEAPPGSFGAVAEVEFVSGDRKLSGVAFGSIGDRAGRTAWRTAIDNKTETFFESGTADGQFVGLDLLDRATPRTPALAPPPGDHDKPLTVTLHSPTPGASVRYTLDGTNPGVSGGIVYQGPIAVDRTTTLVAVAVKEGLAPSPPASGTYLVGTSDRPALKTLHVGNSLTATTGRFAMYARTAGYRHEYRSLLAPGAWTRQLWNVELTKQKDKWEQALAALPNVDHFTVQPRDFDIEEEAGYDLKFFQLVREKTPEVQPWLYAEWTEQARQRPTDKGTVASRQMSKTYPALSWEESMAGMLLYIEDLQSRLVELDKQGKRPRVIPSALAMGRIHDLIERGKFPGASPGSFYPLLYADQVHPNQNGAYLVDLTWFAAFYGETPVGKVLPVGTDLTAEQAAVMQELAWDVVKNYPDCGLYDASGTTPAGAPEFGPSARKGGEEKVTPMTLSSTTPGAWFRYTLDGTTPTRTRGYVYCGVISARPGMTIKAVAFKSGLADSPVSQATFP